MKLYLAGPMRGIPDLNVQAFNAAARILKDRGHEVQNPAQPGGGFTPADPRAAIGYGLQWVATYADAVVLLPGWGQSTGAMAEIAAARAVNIPVYELEEFLKR